MALHFDEGEDFAVDKPAGVACPNLADHACRVHDRLEAEGFPGCRRYDCAGAGQRVTQGLFGGRSWQDDPALLRPMIEAFRQMRRVQDRLAMLVAAEALPLSGADAARRAELEAALCDDAVARGFEGSAVAAEVDGFVASLRGYVAGGERRGSAPDPGAFPARR